MKLRGKFQKTLGEDIIINRTRGGGTRLGVNVLVHTRSKFYNTDELVRQKLQERIDHELKMQPVKQLDPSEHQAAPLTKAQTIRCKAMLIARKHFKDKFYQQNHYLRHTMWRLIKGKPCSDKVLSVFLEAFEEQTKVKQMLEKIGEL
jgi:hypothetical protein